MKYAKILPLVLYLAATGCDDSNTTQTGATDGAQPDIPSGEVVIPIPFTGGLSKDTDSGVFSDSITNINIPSFEGTAMQTTKISLEIAGRTYKTTTNDEGQWKIRTSSELSAGKYSYRIFNEFGENRRQELTGELVIDKTASLTVGLLDKSDSGVSQTDSITNCSDKLVFGGKTDAGSFIGLDFNNKSYKTTVNEAGQWEIAIQETLPDGIHDYAATSTDPAGNMAMYESHIEVDTLMALTVNSVDSDDLSPEFSGSADKHASIKLQIKQSIASELEAPEGEKRVYTTTANSDGKWTLSVGELGAGSFSYEVLASDIAGNANKAEGSFTLSPAIHDSRKLSPISPRKLFTTESSNNVVSVVSNDFATAKLMNDGRVVTSGDDNFGGDASLVDVSDANPTVKLVGSKGAFAALKNDGSAVAWGNSQYGGDASQVDLSSDVRIVDIVASDDGFEAIKYDGTTVRWGSETFLSQSGSVSVIATSKPIVGFTFKKPTGEAITWGEYTE